MGGGTSDNAGSRGNTPGSHTQPPIGSLEWRPRRAAHAGVVLIIARLAIAALIGGNDCA